MTTWMFDKAFCCWQYHIQWNTSFNYVYTSGMLSLRLGTVRPPAHKQECAVVKAFGVKGAGESKSYRRTQVQRLRLTRHHAPDIHVVSRRLCQGRHHCSRRTGWHFSLVLEMVLSSPEPVSTSTTVLDRTDRSQKYIMSEFCLDTQQRRIAHTSGGYIEQSQWPINSSSF